MEKAQKTPESLTVTQVGEILLEVVDKLCSFTGEDFIPAHQLRMLLLIAAASEAPAVLELGKKLGLKNAVTSRGISSLGKGKPASGKKGLGLIEYYEDPTNYSRKRLTLTDKGREVLDDVGQVLSKYRIQRPPQT